MDSLILDVKWAPVKLAPVKWDSPVRECQRWWWEDDAVECPDTDSSDPIDSEDGSCPAAAAAAALSEEPVRVDTGLVLHDAPPTGP